MMMMNPNDTNRFYNLMARAIGHTHWASASITDDQREATEVLRMWFNQLHAEANKEKPEVDWTTIPPWIHWVAMNDDDRWYMFDYRPTYTGKSWLPSVGSSIRIPDDYAPDYSGTAENSLVQRPTP